MKAFLIFNDSGPLLILSRFDSVKQPELMNRLKDYGKFMAYEVPMESDDFRVLNTHGH